MKIASNIIIVVGVTIAIVAILGVLFYNGGLPTYKASTATEAVTKSVVPSITLLSAPSQVDAGSNFSVSWEIKSDPKTITHTAVHYDTKSHPSDYGVEISPAQSGYPSFTKDYASGSFNIPNTFSVQITAPNEVGKLYYRVHVIIDSKHYWTDEKVIDVKTTQTTTGSESTIPTVQAKEFTIEADDSGFYQDGNEITSITTKGVNTTIVFKVREVGTYYGGLDFRSEKFNTNRIEPGKSTTVNFIAYTPFTISSYWPASQVLKATLEVNVV